MSKLLPRLGFALFSLVLAVFSLVLAVPGAARADFDAGFAGYVIGDYATAFSEWLPMAEAGHVEAQFGLGMLYRDGRGVARDRAESARWFQRAAEQGSMRAQTQIAGMYARGEGVAEDWGQAIGWWRRAAAQGSTRAQFHLGQAYEFGSGVEPDLAMAEQWYGEAAAQGYAPAQSRLDEVARLRREEAAAVEEASPVVTDGVAEGDGEAVGVVLTLALPDASVVHETRAALEAGQPAGAAPLIALSGDRVQGLAGAHRVYFASYRSIEDAAAAWRRVSSANQDLLEGLVPAVGQVDLGRDKGILYRLQAGPVDDGASATALCRRLTERAVPCVVVRPE